MALVRDQRDHGAADGLRLFTHRDPAQFRIDRNELFFHRAESLAQAPRKLQIAQGLDNHLASDVTGAMSSHTICYHPHPGLGPIQARILVDLTHLADIGSAR